MAKPLSFEVGDVVRVGEGISYFNYHYGPPPGSVGIVKRVLQTGDCYIVGFFNGQSFALDYIELDLIRLNKET